MTPHIGVDALVADVWSGILKAAEDHNVNLICFIGGELRSHREFQDQANVLYDLANSANIAGLVLWGSALRNFIGSEAFNTFCTHFSLLPIVELDGIPKSVTESYGYRGMRLAITHLIGIHGCRRVAFIPGAAGNSEAQYRYQAYLDVLRMYNIPFDPDIVAPPDYWDEESGRNAVRILFDQRHVTFEAIAAANDRLAIGVIEALQERRIRIPYDVAVVGFDNNPDGQYISPPLTTVPYPTDVMGQRAIRTLLARLNGEVVGEQVSIPPNLVIRQSCGCANPAVAQAGMGLVTKTEETCETSLVARKDAILKEIEPFLEDHSWRGWTEQVLDAFLIELVRPSSTIFLSTLDDVLGRVTAVNGDVAGWQNVLSVLRRQTLNDLNDAAVRFRAEDLLGQARVLVGETARRNQGYQVLQAEQQTRMLHEISAKLISTFDAKELINVLVRELPRLNIPGCYLALYEDPEAPTEWARLLLAYHEQRHISFVPDGLRFPSRDLLPEEFWPRERFSMIVESLYFQQQQIGFALFEVGPRDGKLYEILRDQLSSALQGTLLIQQVQKHARELAQANADLARKQYILDAFMENVPDAIYFKDLDSRIIRANKAHARRVGVSDPTEEIGKTDFDFFTEPEARLKYEQEQEIIHTGQPLIGIEEQQKRLDGREYWSLTTKMPLRDEHGKIIGTFGISRDITKLKDAQASLERAYEKILSLNDQLKEENLQYYLKAALLSTPVEISPTGIPAVVRETWSAPWLCIVLCKLLFSPSSPAEQTQCAAQQIMTRLRHLYTEYTRDVPLAGMFHQITETEAVLILNVNETSQIYRLCAFLESQSQSLVQECASVLVIGIGKEVTTLDDLHFSYDVAQQALLARQNTPMTQILTPIDAEQGKQEALLFSFPVEQETQLIASVIAGHTYRVAECLQHIIAQNMLEQSRYQKLVAVYDRCLRTLGKILAQHPIPAIVAQEDLFLQFFRANKPDSLSELQSQLLDIFGQLTKYYHQHHRQRADILLQKLLRYLEQHYTDYNLSLTSLAEAFKLTSSYISEYFKERSGIKYVEYLAMLRITKAKELLVTHPDLKISDISKQTGFLNTETFIRTFKRVEGISPGMYRKQALPK